MLMMIVDTAQTLDCFMTCAGQLGHMQVCTSLQTNNHASTPWLSFLQAGCPSFCPANSVKAPKAQAVVRTLQTTKFNCLTVVPIGISCGDVAHRCGCAAVYWRSFHARTSATYSAVAVRTHGPAPTPCVRTRCAWLWSGWTTTASTTSRKRDATWHVQPISLSLQLSVFFMPCLSVPLYVSFTRWW